MGRDKLIQIRATAEEAEGFASIARKLGVSRSELFRGMARALAASPHDRADAIVKGDVFVCVDVATMANMQKQLRLYGAHYNQAVHALNIIKKKPYMKAPEARAQLERIASLLEDNQALRKEFSGKLAEIEDKSFLGVAKRKSEA